MLKWSIFNITEHLNDGMLIRNTLSGAVAYFTEEDLKKLQNWLSNQTEPVPETAISISDEDVSILIEDNVDETTELKKILKETRSKTSIFTLNFLPTTNCQLICSYCFENGINRNEYMDDNTLDLILVWLRKYLASNEQITELRVELFSGEPLIRKDIIKKALPRFKQLATELGLEMCVGLTTNAELLDQETAEFLSKYAWNRVQITLDGPRNVHNTRRIGKNGRPTFDKIMQNILMILNRDYIQKVDLRINFSIDIVSEIPKLINYLSDLRLQDRVKLTFALINNACKNQCSSASCKSSINNSAVADAYILFYKTAQEKGFDIPEEFVAGPFCIATLPHTTVLEPSGSLQKCFCTVGRDKYSFGDVKNNSMVEPRDSRFENFDERVMVCIKEACPLLPICNGGCVHNSLLKYGDSGFVKRFCEKDLMLKINKALLRLIYAT
ncbi:radical SAM protein [Candidatus Parcubacteria bacterium]|nr:radical SAM protein [Candidatus Parcubacteria bacterium]